MKQPADAVIDPRTEFGPGVGTDSDFTGNARVPDDDEALEALREILIDRYRQRITVLQSDVEEIQAILDLLEEQVNDKEALITTLTPVMSDAINTSIRNSREEMIEALYPITGRLVSRAVSEAMRDLVRSIDHQMRDAFGIENIRRRLLARASGVSTADMLIRSSLPFQVDKIFLIHRESGLLITHLSSTPEESDDSDLISGMLTAIRDFVQDAFGRGSEGELDTIQYGDMQILIEAGRYVYIAAVVHGFEPPGYRAQLRESLHQIGSENFRALRHYEGDATQLAGLDAELTPLLVKIDPSFVEIAPTHRPSDWLHSLNRLLLWSGFVVVLGLFAWRLWMMFSS